MTLQQRIVRDPAICAGQPVIRGTRVLARVVWEYLAHGETIETILREFPSLTEEDVRAVLACAGGAPAENLPNPAPWLSDGTPIGALTREPSNVVAGETSGPAVSAMGLAPPDAALSYDADGVDRSLIRWMLRLTPRQRLDYLQGMIDLVRSARRIPNGDR